MDTVATPIVEEVSPAARLFARYRDPELTLPAESPPWNTVLDTLLSHRTVRRYSSQPMPPGLLETVLAAAQSAPSSSNLQAWSVIAVEDPERKARLAQFAGKQRHVAEAPLLLIFVADLSILRAASNERSLPGGGLDYLEMFIIGVADAAFAAQNTVVALESMGLGSCYIGAMRNNPEQVAAELGLPPEAFAVFGLTVGYPDPEVATDVKPRLPQGVVLHREQYSATPAQSLGPYDERMRGFQREQKMAEIDWTDQSTRRVKGPESLTGRDRLQTALKSMGFGLR